MSLICDFLGANQELSLNPANSNPPQRLSHNFYSSALEKGKHKLISTLHLSLAMCFITGLRIDKGSRCILRYTFIYNNDGIGSVINVLSRTRKC